MSMWCERCEQHITKCSCRKSAHVRIPEHTESRVCDNCGKADNDAVVLCDECLVVPVREAEIMRDRWSREVVKRCALEATISAAVRKAESLPHYIHCMSRTAMLPDRCDCQVSEILAVLKEGQ